MLSVVRGCMIVMVLAWAAIGAVSAAPLADPVSVWALPGVLVDGAPAAQYRSPGTASLVHPVTHTFSIPAEKRWGHGRWYLEGDLNVENAVLTARRTDGSRVSLPFGMLIPYADRSMRRGIPTVMIPPNVALNAPLELSVTSDTDHPHLAVLSVRTLVADDRAMRANLTFPLLLICGILLSLALTNLVIFASSRDHSYLYYCGVMCGAAAMTVRSSPEIFWGWIFPHISVPFLVVDVITAVAFALFLLAFARSFLKTRELQPRYDKVIVAALAAFVGAVVVGEFFYTSAPHAALADFTGVLYQGTIVIAGVRAMRKGNESAVYYVIAFSGVFFGLLSYDIFKVFGHAFWLLAFLGMCWEGLWLTAALADRMKRLREAREREQEQRLAEREHEALHDALTGLFNRRQIEHELAAMKIAAAGASLNALLYVDLDHFKVINDTCGHVVGDQFLVRLAQLLRESIGHRDTLARVGGDQFVIIARNRSDQEIRALAEGIRETIALQHFAHGTNRFPISASIGCAMLRESLSAPALLALADAACARAKDAGRNTVHVVSDEDSAASARSEMAWVGRIGEAFAQERFRLFYQTIVPLQHSRHRGKHIELLVRMLGEDGSVIEPSHFIPAAERYNVMSQIDRWVIATALPLMQPLVARHEIESVAINLSGNTLREDDLGAFILRTIKDSRIDPSALCFEITETVVASELGKLTTLTSLLRNVGIRVSLDDFGTGTSSLALLKRLDIDYLKIDGSFVRDCANNPVDAAMVEAIHRFASLLGLQTIAEFASSDLVVERLRAIGVDYAQGWAFSRAVPLEELTNAISA